jgi:RNA polymerase sigma-70 factor (ECF subfamily)
VQEVQSCVSAAIDGPPADPGGNDGRLVARAKQGDATAFALLYRLYVGRIYAFAARRLGERGAAEEATQETFARALAGLGRVQADAAVGGWLFAIAGHVIQEQQRTQRRVGALSPPGDPADPEPTPEESALRADAAADLAAARARCLGAGEQALLDLLMADLTDREIATALGRRPGAVRTARWRLVRKLRDCLTSPGPREEGRHEAR